MKKYTVAVIGCGVISDIYFKNMTEKFAILECKYCCDMNQKVADLVAEKYNIKAVSYEEILNNKEIDIVVNLTPPTAHFNVIKDLLNAGKHVYTEKTLSPTFEEANELVELAKSKGLQLCSAPDTFLGAGIQTSKYIVDSGLIGTPTSCVAVLQRDSNLFIEKYPFIMRTGGGIGIDVGIYYSTALTYIFGNAKRVSGMVRTFNEKRNHWFMSKGKNGEEYTIESETFLAGTVEYENGVIGSFHFNSDSIRHEAPFVTVYGTDGILFIPDPNCFGKEVKVQLKGQTEPMVFPHTHGYAEDLRGLGVAEMAWSIEKNRTPRANGGFALHALEILQGIVESSETEKFYNLKSSFEKVESLPKGYLGKFYGESEEEGALSR